MFCSGKVLTINQNGKWGWDSNESKWVWDGQKFYLIEFVDEERPLFQFYPVSSYLVSPVNGSEIKLTKETDTDSDDYTEINP